MIQKVLIILFIFICIIFIFFIINKNSNIHTKQIEKYSNNKKEHVINLVAFYSEGHPNDNGLNLSKNKELVLQQIKHFNNISFYTPKILKNMGMGEYVKEYENSGLVSMNPGMSKIGFCAWRPKILLLEL
jgi:hypothetical protein